MDGWCNDDFRREGFVSGCIGQKVGVDCDVNSVKTPSICMCASSGGVYTPLQGVGRVLLDM